MRNDASLVRHLTNKFGADCATQWQKVPYVMLPDRFIDRVRERDADLVSKNKDSQKWDLDNLAWNDVVYDFGSSVGRGNLWVRARVATSWSWPWIPESWRTHLEPNDWIILECWESETNSPMDEHKSFPSWPDIMAIHRFDGKTLLKFYTNGECKNRLRGAFCTISQCTQPSMRSGCVASHYHMQNLGVIALNTIDYLSQVPDYMVEVKDSKAKEDEKNKKPWTRKDLSHFILIDPGQVSDYRADPDAVKGIHASPKPHQRRGHWRRIRIDDPEQRKVFIRPTWVGLAEWEYQGQIYRVKI